MAKANRNEDAFVEWLGKLIRGAAGGLVLSIIMAITGAFKGDSAGMVILCFVSYMFYGIGFSFGTLITKLVWRKFVARGKTIGIWMAMTGRGFPGLLIAIFVMLFGLTVSCVLGLVLCIVDLVLAIQKKRLLTEALVIRYGGRQYRSANAENVIETAVRFNYEDHGTADIGQPDHSRGYTPTEQQVYEQTQRKKHEMSYWN